MRRFRMRNDLERAVIDGFALPLGLEPGRIGAPKQGYILAYTPGEEEPDTYAFHVVVSHERLAPLVRSAFGLLPAEIYAIVEISSRDAYRTTDVFLGEELIRLEDFRQGWERFEPFLLEDGTVAAGANSDDPFVEIFLDQWKGLSIHVPPSMREEVEAVLAGFELEEVAQTWDPSDGGEGTVEPMQTRPVLDVDDASDIDELLLELRRAWRLELNIDPETNVDESGRRLGLTLWHAVVVVADAAGAADRGGYASIWATAGSLQQMERLIEGALEDYPEWKFQEIYAIDRVAYDERPEALVELPPRSTEVAVHQVYIDTWESPPEPAPEPPDG